MEEIDFGGIQQVLDEILGNGVDFRQMVSQGADGGNILSWKGILVSVLSQVLKHSGREEQAFLTSLAGLLIVLFWIIPYVYELFETMQQLFLL